MADEGQRHHYIPVAYLKNWMNAEGKICQYSKPYDERVVAKSKHPSGTGYIRGLYEFSGVQDQQLRDALEHEFMRPVDTRAAELLQEMVAGEQTMNNVEKRSSWTSFLLSLISACQKTSNFTKSAIFEIGSRPIPNAESTIRSFGDLACRTGWRTSSSEWIPRRSSGAHWMR